MNQNEYETHLKSFHINTKKKIGDKTQAEYWVK